MITQGEEGGAEEVLEGMSILLSSHDPGVATAMAASLMQLAAHISFSLSSEGIKYLLIMCYCV